LENHPNLVKAIMDENISFFQSDLTAKESLAEIEGLLEDALKYVGWKELPEDPNGQYALNFAIINFIHFVLLPLSCAISFDFLGGNLPACFMQLRLLLEQLAKCFFADLNYQDLNLASDKIKHLEAEDRGITRMVSELNLADKTLYAVLSNDWVHLRYLGPIVRMFQRGDVQLLVPVACSQNELPEIRELGEAIRTYRVVLANTLQEWKTRLF
jgi:hypothetical protein